jgi:hypothetical protein
VYCWTNQLPEPTTVTLCFFMCGPSIAILSNCLLLVYVRNGVGRNVVVVVWESEFRAKANKALMNQFAYSRAKWSGC